MNEIGITEVLNEVNQPVRDTEVHTFSIQFIRIAESKNGKAGEAKSVKRARKYMRDSNDAQKSPGTGRKSYQLRENSTLLLRDMATGQPFHVKIWSITDYNGLRVRH